MPAEEPGQEEEDEEWPVTKPEKGICLGRRGRRRQEEREEEEEEEEEEDVGKRESLTLAPCVYQEEEGEEEEEVHSVYEDRKSVVDTV